jgi:UDP-N-acetyl-D-glucosamine dehydrogenase
MIKVCIQGLGFVGAAMAAAVSSRIHKNNKPIYNVIGIDLDNSSGKERINLINKGEFPFVTSDKSLLKEIKASQLRGNLKASSDISHFRDADVVLVSTNCDLEIKDGHEKINLKSFSLGINTLSEVVKEDVLIIIESTVPPGTCEKIIYPILKKSFKKRSFDIDKLSLAHSYERVMPGENYYDSIINYWRVFAGINKSSALKCKVFLKTIINTDEYPLTELKSTIASETAKVLENSYRAVNIAFIDEWSRFAEDANIDLFEVIDAIRFRPTHNNIRQPGFGVGGYCLTKDPLFAKIAAKEILNIRGHDFLFSTNAVSVNSKMPLESLKKLTKYFKNNLKGKRLLIMGVTYREDIGDTRFSPSEVFARAAINKGALIEAYDPLVENWPELNDIKLLNQLPTAENYDAILFTVAHKYFKKIKIQSWLKNKKTLIFDTNNVLTLIQRKIISDGGYNFLYIGRGK